jgi:PAS domain-containing protein
MESRHIAIAGIGSPETERPGHAVHFYEDDQQLIAMLGRNLGAALASGDTAIVVATRTHRRQLRKKFASDKVDTAAASKGGRYLELDASATLARILSNGWPKKQRFEDEIGSVIGQAETELRAGKRLLIFGEMVALLWAEGKVDATLRLEELWNELAEQYGFQLLCGYPVGAFDGLKHTQRLFSICGEHNHIAPTESHAGEGTQRPAIAPEPGAELVGAAIRTSQERARDLQKVPRSATWELDIANDTFSFSSAAARLLGFDLSRQVRLAQLVDLMYYSGDREALLGQLQAAQRTRKDLAATFRVRYGEETRIISIQGKTFYNSGTPIMLGVISDVTPESFALTQNSVGA